MTSRSLSSLPRKSRLYAWTLANVDSSSHATQDIPAEATSSRDHRIYILGVGNIGRLYAMCLSKASNRVPITLVVHRKELLLQWASRPGIEMVRDGKSDRITDLDIEWWTDETPGQGPVRETASGGSITNLIITTKASEALPQVDRLLPYLDSSSTIAFAQNGMCKLWPPLGDSYVNSRFPGGSVPAWVACVTTHGVTSLGPFRSLHASPAGVMVGSVSENRNDEVPSRFLVEQLCDAPGLAATQVSRKELWVAQLEKLAVNVVLNPLTAILRCKNGELFVDRGDPLPRVIKLLLEETSQVFKALVDDPSSRDIILDLGLASQDGSDTRLYLHDRFSVDNLTTMVYDVGRRVAENTSSMLQDTRAGKRTEIHDLNGWLIETAEALGSCDTTLPTHRELVKLVEEGKQLNREQVCHLLLPSDTPWVCDMIWL